VRRLEYVAIGEMTAGHDATANVLAEQEHPVSSIGPSTACPETPPRRGQRASRGRLYVRCILVGRITGTAAIPRQDEGLHRGSMPGRPALTQQYWKVPSRRLQKDVWAL
jgi:hypothetical protein